MQALTRRKSGAISARKGQSALSRMKHMMSASSALVCDISGSMNRRDAGEDFTETRWEVLVRIVDQLCRDMDDLVLIAFNTEAQMVLETMPPPTGGTDIGKALRFVYPIADGLKKVVLLSDGLPVQSSDELSPKESALQAAQELVRKGIKLDVVYCGPPGGEGSRFLQKLARAGNGKFNEWGLTMPTLLTDGLKQLLLNDGR